MSSIKPKDFFYLLSLVLLFTACKKQEQKPIDTTKPDIAQTGTASIFAGNGRPGTVAGKSAASFTGAWGIVMDKSGNLFVSDYNTTLIRKISPDGNVSTFAGNTTDINKGAPKSTDGLGVKASFMAPAGMAMDDLGNIYVADKLAIRKI